MSDLTRRSVLKNSILSTLGTALPSLEGQTAPATSPGVLNWNSNSGLTIPAKGAAHMKFSFDFPEPSVDAGGWIVSARVYTNENTYALDPSRIRVRREAASTIIQCNRLTWAGGQEKQAGFVEITVRQQGSGMRATTKASVPGKRLKSVALVLRWIPGGELSIAGGEFRDPKADEVLHSWPDLFGGMVSPLMVLRSGTQFCSISFAARKDEVRNARFYLQPGPAGYRAELTYELEAWTTTDTVLTPEWVVRKGSSYEEVAREHYANVEQAFALPEWQTRPDVPRWMHQTQLVVALHGAHWTGYIFNDFARQLQILRWIAQQIDPGKVLIFLPAWDGRYYWNYPAYEVDPRMGGKAGFRRLVEGAQKLGFHLVPMFGSNVANKNSPLYSAIQDALTIRPEGDAWNESYVDWDNDRRADANYGFMNLAVASWRNLLAGKISAMMDEFNVDGYFLDIVGTSENNQQGDMFLGTRKLVQDLRTKFPSKLCIGEMHYDALLGCIPVFQADVTNAYPPAVYKYARMFEHLSWPAPGRGSTGVHEWGFSSRGKLPTVDQKVIPTLTVVDDTFSQHQGEMRQVIDIAREWKGY